MGEGKPIPGVLAQEVLEPDSQIGEDAHATNDSESSEAKLIPDAEQLQAQTIFPTKGEVTNLYISIFGEDDNDLENEKEREVAMIMDGLKATQENYDVFIRNGYVYANAPETVFSEGYPDVGIKIHVVLNPEEESYGEKLLKIAELCLKQSPNGTFTSFKIMTYSNYKDTMEWDPDQARKVVTIYPNYLGKSKTNTVEAVRLVAGLREVMGIDSQNGSGSVAIYGEHKSGNGIYLRAGAFTEKGRGYETVSKTASFEEQLKGNLSSPETDSGLFYKEITEAVKNGLL